MPVLGGVVVLALAALAVAGTRPTTVRRYALDAPNQDAVAILRPGQRACEGPVSAPSGAVQMVAVWGASIIGPAGMRVAVKDARTGQALADGQIRATTHPDEYRAHLNRTVAAKRAVRVCLTSTLNSFSLLGSPAVRAGVTMTGGKRGSQFSLVLLQANGQTLLGSLGLAFSRASLFRPSWVGSWTFWTLLALVASGFVLVVAAVAIADREDTDGSGADHAGSSARTARQ